MTRLLLIGLAGGLGSIARYLVTIAALERFGGAFPVGTLAVNLVGCFLIAAIVHASTVLGWPPEVRVVVAVGFVGGFTTYSSFNFETMKLIEEGAGAAALLNVTLTLAGGFVAGWLGLLAARQLFSH